MPALQKSKEQAAKLKCLSNLRQLGIANAMYLADNKQTMPFCNWDPNVKFTNAKLGWLFEAPLSAGPLAQASQTGAYYKYLKNQEIFFCPGSLTIDAPSFGSNVTIKITSYLMNGAVNAYGVEKTPTKTQFFKVTQFKSNDFYLWEADERGGSAWNDGSSYPYESFNPADPGAAGLSARH